MTPDQQLVGFLQRHIALTGYHSLVASHDLPRLALRGDEYLVASPEDLGQALYERAESEGLRLGNYLGSAEGEALAAAVGYVIPVGYRPAFTLAVEGLTRAAELARQGQRDRARLWAGAVGVGVLLLAVSWRR